MNKDLAISIVQHNGSNKYKIVNKENKVERRRLFYSTNGYGLCEFIKNKTSYGKPISTSEIESWKSIEVYKVDDLTKVKNFISNVVKYLELSGLWSNIKDDYKKILSKDDSFIEELIKSDYKGLKQLLEDNGISSVHCDDLLTSAKKGIVTINYNSWEKDDYRELFGRKILNKETFDYSWRKKYDNSIACKKVNNVMCAWYSTEYKGCGNGHYYFALDEKHAMYVETD